eukprot:1077030-Ditylum_brightwellii.AAC.1
MMRGEKYPNPRKQWYKDLLPEINKWKKEEEILLLTDTNSSLNNKDFSKFVTEAGLFDIMGQIHRAGGINSLIKGTKRIYFALGT